MIDAIYSQMIAEPATKEMKCASRVTGFMEIPGFRDLIEENKIADIEKFYLHLAQEIYETRRKNYSLGLRVIEPRLDVYAHRVSLSSPLFLEKDLPELSSMAFKQFADFCNILQVTALRSSMAIRGFCDIGSNYQGKITSKNIGRAPSKEPMVLTDILEVFNFDEVFPDGFGQQIIPPVSIPCYFGKDLNDSINKLKEIYETGIFFPGDIINYPACELAIYSGSLIETEIDGENYYTCNWRVWLEQHRKDYPIEKLDENLTKLTKRVNGEGNMWRRFLERK